MKFISDSLMIVDSLKTNVATKLTETTNIILFVGVIILSLALLWILGKVTK